MFAELKVFILLIDKLSSQITALVHSVGKVREYHFLSGFMNILAIPIAWVMLSVGCGSLSVYFVVVVMGGVFLSHGLFLAVIRRLVPFLIRDYLLEVFYPFVIVSFISIPLPFLLSIVMQYVFLRFSIFLVVSLFITFSAINTCGLTKTEKNVILELIKRIRG